MVRSARRSVWAAFPRAAVAALVATLMSSLVVPVPAAPAPAARSAAAPAGHVVAGGVEEDAPEVAQDADGEVRVVLDGVEPAVARVGEPVTLQGRVVNAGPQRRRLTTVTVRSAWTPLAHRADVTHWVDGRDLRETGWVLGEDAIGPVVVPGAEVPFRVEVPAHGLDALPGGLAVLALEIEATSEEEAVAPDAPVAAPEPVTLRTVLAAVRPGTVTDPLDVSWVVPLTLPADPALTSPEEQPRHEAWRQATGPGSPARTWLEHLTVDGVTWMVDPALLVPVGPADDLAEPDGDPAPDGPTPAEPDEGTSTSAPGQVDDDSSTGAPGADGAAPTAADDVAATGRPSPGRTDGSAVTSAPEQGPEEGLEDGEQLGGRPGGDASGPTTAEDVEEGLVALGDLLGRSAPEQLWWTPPADPDVAALLTGASSPTAVATAMDLPLPDAPAGVERLLRRGRSDVAWPLLGAPTAADVAAMDRYWAQRPATPDGTAAVIVPRESLSGGSNTSVEVAAARVAGHEDVTALGADTRVAALLSGAAEDAERVGEGSVVQRLLADSLTAYLQDPLEDRSMLYAPPRGSEVPAGVLAALSAGLRSAPWVRSVPASQLVTVAATQQPVALSGVAPAPEVLGGVLVDRVVPAPSPLEAGAAEGLVQLGTALAGLAQVLEDNRSLATWEPVVGHLWSTRWRGEPDAWREAWQAVRRPVTRVREGVHVNPSTVNFLSDQGIMQVTVVNDLPVAVEGVRVEVLPEGSLLRVVQQPDPISIGAESRATVSFTARAVTRGVTTVSARLTTPNGTVLGDDAQVSVRVQPTGVWIYWVLGSIAGLVLVLGLARARRTAPRSAAVAASTTAEEDR